jgi:hypothetical protein
VYWLLLAVVVVLEELVRVDPVVVDTLMDSCH